MMVNNKILAAGFVESVSKSIEHYIAQLGAFDTMTVQITVQGKDWGDDGTFVIHELDLDALIKVLEPLIDHPEYCQYAIGALQAMGDQ